MSLNVADEAFPSMFIASADCEKSTVKRCASSSDSMLRRVVLLATSLISMSVFMLDASLPRGLRASCDSWEVVIYLSCVSAALLYVRYVPLVSQKVGIMTSDAKGDALEKDVVVRTAREFVSQVADAVRWLIKEVRPPPTQPSRPDREKPVVPVWAVYGLFLILVFFSAALAATAFLAAEGGGVLAASNSFLDATPRACGPDGKPVASGGLSWRSTSWLGVALALSSGLCAIHPLQSGLVIGF